jgi:PAS domain S-box-containing protein
VVLISPDGVIRFINRVYAGLTMAEVSGRSIFEFLDPGYHEVARACYRDVATTGQAGHYETLGLGSNGEKARYESHVAPVKRGAEVIALTIIARDITLRVELERQLRASRKQLEVAIAASGLGLWSWDPRTDAIEVDAGVLQIHRRSRAEAPATLEALLQCAHPDDHSFVDAGFRRAPMTGEFPDLEYRIVRKDRTIAWVLVKGRVTRDDGDRIVGLLGGAIDVTEQRQAAAALRVSEQRYRSLIAVLDEGILVQDADRTIHTLNASAPGGSSGSANLRSPAWPRCTRAGAPSRPTARPSVIRPIARSSPSTPASPRPAPSSASTSRRASSPGSPSSRSRCPSSAPDSRAPSSPPSSTSPRARPPSSRRTACSTRSGPRGSAPCCSPRPASSSPRSLDIMSLARGPWSLAWSPEHLDLADLRAARRRGRAGHGPPVIVASDDQALAERYPRAPQAAAPSTRRSR